MIAPNDNLLCRQAELHYYDFLHEENRGRIEGHIINHIEHCQNCQNQINQFREVLARAESDFEAGQKGARTAVGHMLKLHFSCIGECVTCGVVKPYLPTLLVPALAIKIPTPITAHIDNCQQCSGDLDTIRRLNLSPKQLRRLSQLLADRSADDKVSCRQSWPAIQWVAAMDWAGIEAKVLRHLCKCHVCRGLLYKERQKFCDRLPDYETSPEFSCEPVSASDIFDYVVPYGLDPADDQYAKFRAAFTSHVVTCSKCLTKVQQLHRTIYAIAERPDSEVVTIYNIDESAKAHGESADIYAGFPIRVEVRGREAEVKAEALGPTVNFAAVLKRKFSAANLKPLLKTGAAAVAVMLIAFALLLRTPAAKAATINQIYKAIEQIKNVYIAKFGYDKQELLQEKWVSRSLNIYMTKTGRQLVLWDISNSLKKTKNLDTSAIETTTLTEERLVDVKKKMSGSLGLMPFYDISEIPAEHRWDCVTDECAGTIAEDVEVYDLKWTEKSHYGITVFKKWRVFVDPKTKLPQKIEWYEKSAADADGEYVLILVTVVEYLSNSGMQTILEEASF